MTVATSRSRPTKEVSGRGSWPVRDEWSSEGGILRLVVILFSVADHHAR